MQDLGQLVELATIFEREAHEVSNQVARHLARKVRHEIARTSFDHFINDGNRQALDSFGELTNVARCEVTADETAKTCVVWRVSHEHHLVIAEDGAGFWVVRRICWIADHDRRLAREGLVLSPDSADFLEPGHRPEARTVGLIVPKHGIVRPQPLVELGGVTVGKRRCSEKIDVRCRGHRMMLAGLVLPTPLRSYLDHLDLLPLSQGGQGMSTTGWIDDASAAFESALIDLIGEQQPQLDAAEAGRRAALKAVSGAMWTDAVGPFYDTEAVMSLLGGVSKQAVNDRVRRHRLLALRTGSGRLVYPAAQFHDEQVVNGLGEVLDVLVPDNTEAWMVASWLSTPDPELGNRAPFEALRAGAVDDVMGAARELAGALRG